MNLELEANAELISHIKGFENKKGNFSIQIEGSFESSHYLYEYFEDRRDEPNHGHSWKVFIHLERTDKGLSDDGISVDFLEIRKRLDLLLQRIDHICINDLTEFQGINPTAENIARWFYAGLEEIVNADSIRIIAIKVCEGPYNIAIYCPH